MGIQNQINRNRLSIYLVLVSITFLLLFFIYPDCKYSGGIDPIYYQVLSNKIVSGGNIIWLDHIFAIWGSYPFSENIGTPIFLGVVTSLLSMHTIYNVIIIDFCLTILIVLSSFLLFYNVKKNILFSIIGAFTFSISPKVLSYLVSVVYSRGIILIFSPLWIILCFKFLENFRQKKFILLFFLFSLFLSFHHFMFLFLLPILISFILSNYIHIYGRKIKVQNLRKKSFFGNFFYNKTIKNRIMIFSIYIFISLVALFSIPIISKYNLLPSQFFKTQRYEYGGLFNNSYPDIIYNIMKQFISGTGIALILFGGIGILAFFYNQNKEVKEKTFYLSLLFRGF